MDRENSVKRLLCIVGSMNAGGAETFLMKIYRALDKTKYQMDFYVSTMEKGIYDDEIISMGGKIFRSIPKSKHPIKSFYKLKEVVKNQEYKSVMRVSQHSISSLDLIASKIGGANKLIYRSSNSKTINGKIGELIHRMFKWLSITIPNVKIAPSTEAAKFMFGEKSIENDKVIILKNAIPIDNFVFDNNIREKVRAKLNLEEKFVLGHVGRFSEQKNHLFLIDIFNEVLKNKAESVLLLVGAGELENKIREKVKFLGIEEKVIFLGVRKDIAEIMMAMDVFVFPSFYEGMPNTVIEAQATGLKCVISNTITKEANITKEVKYIDLSNNEDEWARNILQFNSDYTRNNMKYIFEEHGYDINHITKKFIELVF